MSDAILMPGHAAITLKTKKALITKEVPIFFPVFIIPIMQSTIPQKLLLFKRRKSVRDNINIASMMLPTPYFTFLSPLFFAVMQAAFGTGKNFWLRLWGSIIFHNHFSQHKTKGLFEQPLCSFLTGAGFIPAVWTFFSIHRKNTLIIVSKHMSHALFVKTFSCVLR